MVKRLNKPIATNLRVMRFISGGVPWTDEQIRDFVDRKQDIIPGKGILPVEIGRKTSSEMIGFCGLGARLASEATRAAAFDDATNRLRQRQIVSVAHQDNDIRRKLGMRQEEEYQYAETPPVMYAFEG